MELQTNENKRNGQDKVIILLVLLILILIASNEHLLVKHLNGNAPVIAQAQQEIDAANEEKAALYNELQEAKAAFEKAQEVNPVLMPYMVPAKNGQIKNKISQIEHLITSGSPSQLKQAKEQLPQLRTLNNQFGSELDSLRQQNSLLSKQYSSTREELNATKAKRDSLAMQNYRMGSKIAMGTVLATKNLSATPVRIRATGGEEVVTRANFTQKLKLRFTIAENDMVSSGTKTVYIRIIDPAGNPITRNDDFIIVDGIPTAYTFKQLVKYENQDTPLTIFWAKEGLYPPGTYMAEVIVEGHLIGNMITTLK